MKKEMTYLECLNTLSDKEIDRLFGIASEYVKDEVKKKELTLDEKKDIIYTVVISNGLFTALFFTKEEEEELIGLIEGKKVEDISDTLKNTYFCFKIDDEFVVPIEIKEMYDDIKADNIQESKFKMMVDFYLEYNGALDVDDLVKLMNSSGMDVTKKKLIEYLESDNFIIENNIVYLNEFAKRIEENDQYELKSANLRVFDFREAYANYQIKLDYIGQLANILEKYSSENEFLAGCIVDIIMVGFDLIKQSYLLLDDKGIKLSKKDKAEFDEIINKISRVMPLWVYSGFSLSEYENQELWLLHDELVSEYVHAYLLLNGIIEIDLLLDILEKEHQIEIDKKELNDIVSKLDDLKIYKNYVTVTGVDEDMFTILDFEKKNHKKYKIIDNFRKINDEDEENVEKIANICREFNLDDVMEQVLISVISLGRFNEEVLDITLDSYNIKMNDTKKKVLLEKLNDVYLNTRLWRLNGFKMGEISVVSKSNKIGRNEPCSCGSGKKYKKCCGK